MASGKSHGELTRRAGTTATRANTLPEAKRPAHRRASSYHAVNSGLTGRTMRVRIAGPLGSMRRSATEYRERGHRAVLGGQSRLGALAAGATLSPILLGRAFLVDCAFSRRGVMRLSAFRVPLIPSHKLEGGLRFTVTYGVASVQLRGAPTLRSHDLPSQPVWRGLQ